MVIVIQRLMFCLQNSDTVVGAGVLMLAPYGSDPSFREQRRTREYDHSSRTTYTKKLSSISVVTEEWIMDGAERL